jgi:tetratricopeptide (TPR) repeat protein
MNEGIRSLLVEKDTNTAIREFTEAARLRPQDAVPYFNLARAYGQAGNQELRIKNIEEGLLRDPENKALKNEKALILIDKKEFREAISVLKELPADDPVVAWNLWFAYRNIGENDNAVAELKRIIEVQADSRIATSAEKQLHELEDDAARLSTMRRSLWIALLGLGCVAVIGTIILLARFASRGSTKQKPTKPADVLALKVQIIVTAISCVFGLLTVVLPRIIK